METLIFDPKTKFSNIKLEDLDKTLKFEDGGGKLPQSAPIHHADLIKKVINIAKQYAPEYEAVLTPIVVKQDNCKRIMFNGPVEECPLTNYSVERLVAKIGFKGSGAFPDDINARGVMAVGISYNEKGIQVAFGHNVNVCQNLNVFGENVFSTYSIGGTKVPFDKGMQLIEHWMQNFKENRQIATDNIEKLRSIIVTEDERLRVFGKIYELAVRTNEGERTLNAPLNVTECTRMVAEGFHHMVKDTSKAITAWDITNWATSVLKPETSDMVNLLVKNSLLNNFLMKEFSKN